MLDRIDIGGILARGVIGLSDRERSEPQDVLVSLRLGVDLHACGLSDDVRDSVNYADTQRLVVDLVERAAYRTVESLATNIAILCFVDARVVEAVVRVEKPTAEHLARSVAVELTRRRGDGIGRLAFVSLGSNVQPERMLPRAVDRMRELGHVAAVSGVYESAAFGGAGANYLNAAAMLHTAICAEELHAALKRMEVELGRDNSRERVAIDMDLSLLLPVPSGFRSSSRIAAHSFVARPLSELLPSLSDPTTGKSLAELAAHAERGHALTPRTDVVLRASAAPTE